MALPLKALLPQEKTVDFPITQPAKRKLSVAKFYFLTLAPSFKIIAPTYQEPFLSAKQTIDKEIFMNMLKKHKVQQLTKSATKLKLQRLTMPPIMFLESKTCINIFCTAWDMASALISTKIPILDLQSTTHSETEWSFPSNPDFTFLGAASESKTSLSLKTAVPKS